MAKDKKIGGVIFPLATPLNGQNDLDLEKAQDLIEWHIDNGVDGFYVEGSTGEGILQSVDEGCRSLGYVADVVDNRGLPIAQADRRIEVTGCSIMTAYLASILARKV